MVLSLARSRKLPLVYVGRVQFAVPLLLALGVNGIHDWLDSLRRLPGGPSVLSMHVYATEMSEKELGGQLLMRAGFEPEPRARGFHRTLLVPVNGSAAERLERISYAARRGIRQVHERGYGVAPVVDTSAAPRLTWLNAQARRRTGGQPHEQHFATIIETARLMPLHSVLLGVYHPERSVDTALVGFAHAFSTGTSVVYASAGTERAADIGSTPLSYGVVWRLLEWTAGIGCDLFDFGGVTPLEEQGNPLAGISEFKRKFRGAEAHVASDYSIPLKRASAALLHALERPARLLRGH